MIGQGTIVPGELLARSAFEQQVHVPRRRDDIGSLIDFNTISLSGGIRRRGR